MTQHPQMRCPWRHGQMPLAQALSLALSSRGELQVHLKLQPCTPLFKLPGTQSDVHLTLEWHAGCLPRASVEDAVHLAKGLLRRVQGAMLQQMES